MLSPLKGFKETGDEVKIFFVVKMRITLGNTMEQIKKSLLQNNKELPNPAAFSVGSRVKMPYRETFIPLAKKLLVNKIAA